jgi:hypothetical protein
MDSREESRDGKSVCGLLRYQLDWFGCHDAAVKLREAVFRSKLAI